MEESSVIVIGGLNTDIIASGVTRFPGPGEHVYGKQLTIGPGGKSRNIAAMAGTLMEPNQVAMIGRTSQDEYGLWKLPVDALKAAGVNTEGVHILSFAEAQKLPAIALIPVNDQGENQIFVLPGVSDDFDSADIDAAQALFDAAGKQQGLLILTLECPLETARYAINKALATGMKVALDPGGIELDTPIAELIRLGVYLLKPNEHEAKLITGVEVKDFESAKQAAQKMLQMGAQNVLITHGDKGAYLFTQSEASHISIPVIENVVKDSTGCGDQTMASLGAYLQQGKTLREAAEIAIFAGTLQFHKNGIQPITKPELEARL
jgi:ribokinase